MERKSRSEDGTCPILLISSLLAVILCSGASALGNSPFRLEAAYYAPGAPSYLSISGLVDINRPLALRLHVVNVWPEYGSHRVTQVGVQVPGNQVDLIVSPFRKKLKIQPYAFGGLGVAFSSWSDTATNRVIRTTELHANLGLGAEPLLFFLPRVPSLFLETGLAAGGRMTYLRGPDTSGPLLLLPEIKAVLLIAFGIRI